MVKKGKEEYSFIKLEIHRLKRDGKLNYSDVAIHFRCSERTASRWIKKFHKEKEEFMEFKKKNGHLFKK